MPRKRAREAINAHRTRWFRETHSFASVCVVFFSSRGASRHPLDKEREGRSFRAKSSLSPPGTTWFPTKNTTQKERGNFCVSRISRVFYPSRGFKNASNVKKRSSEMRCVRVREKLRVLRMLRLVEAWMHRKRARMEEEGGGEIQSVVRFSEQNERRKKIFLRAKTLNIH